MVDDILCLTSAENSVNMNNLVNTFIESKNLTLSSKKCFQIQIGKGHQYFPKLKVHETVMKESDQEKYLGDMAAQNSTIQTSVESRNYDHFK